ncbi:hypothetical protein EG329_007579 [Mollisiaceae sp. DMI_Dod_QoI]|nr:hypothetical protein EG329_007579 [Helotiales sp. DMI_Dod_QoI]
MNIPSYSTQLNSFFTLGTSDPEDDRWILKKKDDIGPKEKFRGNFHLDALEVEFANGNSGSMSVFLFKVFGPMLEGLILRHVEGSTFSRLGVFADRGGNQIEWLNSSPTETITLI